MVLNSSYLNVDSIKIQRSYMFTFSICLYNSLKHNYSNCDKNILVMKLISLLTSIRIKTNRLAQFQKFFGNSEDHFSRRILSIWGWWEKFIWPLGKAVNEKVVGPPNVFVFRWFVFYFLAFDVLEKKHISINYMFS